MTVPDPPRRPQRDLPPRVLAADLDGTLIPLPHRPAHRTALRTLEAGLRAHQRPLLFVTGRRFDSVLAALELEQLPAPAWIASDVGTTLHQSAKGSFHPVEDYRRHLAERIAAAPLADLELWMRPWKGLVIQEPEHQQPFKRSYYAEGSRVESLATEINFSLEAEDLPWRALGLVDPFDGRGMLDLLPAGVSKASALHWLAAQAGFHWEEVVFAGDSGNDFAALVGGFRAVIMQNATPGLAERARLHLAAHDLAHRLYQSRTEATEGVLEGCRHFGLLPPEA